MNKHEAKLKFDQKFGLDYEVEGELYDSDAPCYVVRAKFRELKSKAQIREFIRLARKTEVLGLISFSVTAKDKCCKMFLEVVRETKVGTIIETKSRNHGGYPCYYILYPAMGKA